MGTDSGSVGGRDEQSEPAPHLAQAWRAGRIATDTVAVIARGLRPIPHAEQAEVVNAVLPHLPRLSRKALRRFIATAVDVLTPDQPEVTEQRRHARRYLAFSHYAGMTHIRADLPDIDGAAVHAAIKALAESLRVDGDGLTPGQRHADALMTLINAAAPTATCPPP